MGQLNRYTLVPRASRSGSAGTPVRRYSLARVAPSPRSALGHDRHERLERAASPGGERLDGQSAPRPA